MNYSKLKDICITTQGIQISKDKQINKFKEGYIKYLYIADFKGENEEKFVENVYPEKIVTENDLVMANTGSPGAVFKGINGVLSNNLFKISFDRNILDRDFLYYYLASDKFQSNLQQRMKGGVQKHLGHKTIGEQDIPIIDINTQKRIVTVLNKSQKLINKRKEQIDLLDKLVKSKFIEMFGDPVSNPMNWEKKRLADECNIITGNTPSRKVEGYYGDYIEWIKSDNITDAGIYLTKAREYLSEEGLKVGRSVEENSILMTCIAGSIKCIGNVAIANRKVTFNQQINGIEPLKNNVYFMFEQFNLSQKYIQSTINMSLKGILSKGQLSELEFIFPPIEKQDEFAEFFKQVDKLKFEMEKSLKELEDNFNSLMQKAFNGELFI